MIHYKFFSRRLVWAILLLSSFHSVVFAGNIGDNTNGHAGSIEAPSSRGGAPGPAVDKNEAAVVQRQAVIEGTLPNASPGYIRNAIGILTQNPALGQQIDSTNPNPQLGTLIGLANTPFVDLGTRSTRALGIDEDKRTFQERAEIAAHAQRKEQLMKDLGTNSESEMLSLFNGARDRRALGQNPLDGEMKTKMAAFGNQIGDLMNSRFTIGNLSSAADDKTNKALKEAWAEAKGLEAKIKSGDLKRDSLDPYQKGIVESYEKGQKNREEYWKTVSEVLAGKQSASALEPWSEKMPAYLQALKKINPADLKGDDKKEHEFATNQLTQLFGGEIPGENATSSDLLEKVKKTQEARQRGATAGKEGTAGEKPPLR